MADDKKFLVIQERTNCHQSVFDEVIEAEYSDIRILKEPNKSKLHPAGKVIVVVETMEQAEKIRQHCVNQIQQSNIRIEEILKKTAPRYEIKYKINIVRASGDVFLSVRDADSRKNVSGSDVIKTLQSFLERLDENKEDDKATAEVIRKDIQKIQKNKKYTWAHSTGNNYRITYYDSDNSKRVQASVGNVMIVVSDSQTKIQNAPERKQRTDKKEPLFVIRLPLFGIVSVYPTE